MTMLGVIVPDLVSSTNVVIYQKVDYGSHVVLRGKPRERIWIILSGGLKCWVSVDGIEVKGKTFKRFAEGGIYSFRRSNGHWEIKFSDGDIINFTIRKPREEQIKLMEELNTIITLNHAARAKIKRTEEVLNIRFNMVQRLIEAATRGLITKALRSEQISKKMSDLIRQSLHIRFYPYDPTIGRLTEAS